MLKTSCLCFSCFCLNHLNFFGGCQNLLKWQSSECPGVGSMFEFQGSQVSPQPTGWSGRLRTPGQLWALQSPLSLCVLSSWWRPVPCRLFTASSMRSRARVPCLQSSMLRSSRWGWVVDGGRARLCRDGVALLLVCRVRLNGLGCAVTLLETSWQAARGWAAKATSASLGAGVLTPDLVAVSFITNFSMISWY